MKQFDFKEGDNMAAFTLEKHKTGSTPYVLVDEENSYMKFEGECFHENVVRFFEDIIVWLEEFLKRNFKQFVFDCQLQYFNSSTAKLLLNMLTEMDEHAKDGKKVVVNWITTEDNDIIIECGEDFQEEMLHLEFNVVIN